MEIEVIAGNDEKVIVVESYYVMQREHTGKVVIEWKYDRRQPKLVLKGGNVAEAEENLMKTFKEGEYITFNEMATNGKNNKK